MNNYKIAIADQLAVAARRREEQRRIAADMDEELLSRILPEPSSPVSETERILEDHASPVRGAAVGSDSLKRGLSAVTSLSSIPKKKSRVPALVSIDSVMTDDTVDTSSKKKVLMTRQSLRSAGLDPRGLLNLENSSTSALEQAKTLELLKCAGYSFSSTGKKSFPDRFNAARVRLDSGMGGQSISDSLLFGAKVLSCPGALHKKY